MELKINDFEKEFIITGLQMLLDDRVKFKKKVSSRLGGYNSPDVKEAYNTIFNNTLSTIENIELLLKKIKNN